MHFKILSSNVLLYNSYRTDKLPILLLLLKGNWSQEFALFLFTVNESTQKYKTIDEKLRSKAFAVPDIFPVLVLAMTSQVG